MKTVKIEQYSITDNFDLQDSYDQKIIISTINAHSWVAADRDAYFKKALVNSNFLLPDGVGIVLAAKVLKNEKISKLSGYELHKMTLERLNQTNGKCFYLGSSERVLNMIREKISIEYPNIQVGTYSPPFKKEFSQEDNKAMIDAVNAFSPSVLFVGMTAPKQEKWVEQNKDYIDAKIICSIGAVFDFYSGNIKRAPQFMIDLWLEWLYRNFKNPIKMAARNVSIVVFIYKIYHSKLNSILKNITK